MAQATSNNSISIDSSRRRFLAFTAVASAVGAGALATAVGIPATVIPQAVAAPLDDSRLVNLEGQIFEQYEGGRAFDDEISKLQQIWTSEFLRLRKERPDMTEDERWAAVTEMPEGKEQTRLVKLQEPFDERMDVLVKEMFATPAKTSEGRRAKATVLLGCILGDDWRGTDAETDYPEQMTRSLLIEFIGGEPGERLRGQFA